MCFFRKRYHKRVPTCELRQFSESVIFSKIIIHWYQFVFQNVSRIQENKKKETFIQQFRRKVFIYQSIEIYGFTYHKFFNFLYFSIHSPILCTIYYHLVLIYKSFSYNIKCISLFHNSYNHGVILIQYILFIFRRQTFFLKK